jgi:hypothetical protein
MGFVAEDRSAGSPDDSFRGVHHSGLPLNLHCSLASYTAYDVSLPAVRGEIRPFEVGGASGWTLGPADQLFHACVQAASGWHRHKLLWATDTWLIIDRTPNIDWDRLLSLAATAEAAIPLSLMIRYLTDHLDAAVPERVVESLESMALRSSRHSREVALFGAWSRPGPKLSRALRASSSWRERILILRWRSFPAPAALVASGRISAQRKWPLWHLSRPLRFLLGVLRPDPAAPDST